MSLVFMCVLIMWVLLGDSSDFDERQQLDRGKATYAALWAFLSYALPMIIFVDAYASEYPILKDSFSILLIGATFVMLVYLTVAIVLDAYVPLNFPGMQYLYLVFGAVALAAMFVDMKMADFLYDRFRWVCLALGIVFLWSGALMIIMKPIRKYLDSKIED